MRAKDLLTEANRNKVLLIDFQPAYANYYSGSELRAACAYINSKPNVEVLAFYNGADVGIEDTEGEVMWHYVEDGGLDEDANISFREKGYAFLRSWMDQGVDTSVIIKVLREMIRRGFNDSREFEEELEQIVGEGSWEDWMEGDNIYIPDIAINELKSFTGCLMGGGGRDECFKEIQILMSVFNIKHKEVQDWIY